MNDLPPLLTRKHIAVLIGMSVKFVQEREKRIGLHAARVNIGTRIVRFRRKAALDALRARGFIE